VRALCDDVEALLVFQRRGERARECLLVPIDACYALVGLVRQHWRGFSGGATFWPALEGFLADLRSRAGTLPAEGGGGER
jgi:hypothetical protein